MGNYKVPGTQSLIYKGRQRFHVCKFRTISVCLGKGMERVGPE